MSSVIAPPARFPKSSAVKTSPNQAFKTNSLSAQPNLYTAALSSDSLMFAGKKKIKKNSTAVQTTPEPPQKEDDATPAKNETVSPRGWLKTFEEEHPALYKQAKANLKQEHIVSREDFIHARLNEETQHVLAELKRLFDPSMKQRVALNLQSLIWKPKSAFKLPEDPPFDSVFEPEVDTLKKKVLAIFAKKLQQTRDEFYLGIQSGKEIYGYLDPSAKASIHANSLKTRIAKIVAIEALDYTENPLMDECQRLRAEEAQKSMQAKQTAGRFTKPNALMGVGGALMLGSYLQPKAGHLLSLTNLALSTGSRLLSWVPGLSALPSVSQPLSSAASLIGKIPGIDKIPGPSSIPVGWPVMLLGGIMAIKGLTSRDDVKEALALEDSDSIPEMGWKALKKADDGLLNVPSTMISGTGALANMMVQGASMLHPENVKSSLSAGQEYASSLNNTLYGIPAKTVTVPASMLHSLWQNASFKRPQLSFLSKEKPQKPANEAPSISEPTVAAPEETPKTKPAKPSSVKGSDATPPTKDSSTLPQDSKAQPEADSTEETPAHIIPPPPKPEKTNHFVSTPPVKPVVPPTPAPIIEEVIEEDRPDEPEKPEKRPTPPQSTMERYAWPAVHLTAGSSLIAGGALLHLPVITAPIGMGMIAAGSLWAGYGLYGAYKQYSAMPQQ